MSIHSRANKRLVRLYRDLLQWLSILQWRAGNPFPCLLLPRIELLPSRLLFSVTPNGSEALVNQTTANAQQTPATVVNLNGDTIAVWASNGQDGSGWGIYGRKFDAAGNPLTNEFLVNQTTAGDQTQPAIAVDGRGDFVVTWTGNQSGTPTVFARLFNADTTPATGEIGVAAALNGDQDASVAMDANGDFVVAYDGGGPGATQGVFAQYFAAGGTPVGSQTLVNNASASPQLSPAVAMDPQGDYAIAWTDTSGTTPQIKARRFSASGAASTQFLVGTGGADSEGHAQVGIDDGGNTVFAWTSNNASSGTWDVYARRYDRSGNALSVNPVVVTAATAPQNSPSLAVRYDGRYAIAWTAQSQDGSSAQIEGQAYNPDGSPDGSQFQVNTTSAGLRGDPSVGWTGSNAVVVWDGNGVGDAAGAFGQFYDTEVEANQAPVLATPPAQTVSESGSITFSSSNGNAISVVDPDGGGAVEQLALTASNGTLSITNTAGLVFTTGTGVGDTTEVFTGTLANINAALQGLVFTPATSPNPSASLQITANDLGNSGPGGAQTASATVAINVTPVAHTPSITNASTAQGVQTNNGLVVMRNAVDGPAVNWFKINNVGGGTVYLSDGVTVASGFITYAQASAGLKFTPSNNSTGGSFTIQAATAPNDGARGGSPVVATINVYGPPTITAPNNQISPENAPLVFVPGTNTALVISDLLASTVGGLDTVTLATSNATFTLSSSAGLSFSAGAASGSSVVTFTGTVASINNALNGLQLVPSPNFFGVTSVQVTAVNPGTSFTNGPLSASASFSVNVQEVNVAPTVKAPGPQSAVKNTPLTFSTANNNALSVNDVDSNGKAEQVTVVATGGTVTLGSQAGLTFPQNGLGPSTFTFKGTLPNLNAALQGLTFTPTANYTGSASLTVTINDQGNTGNGGAQSATVTIPMTVASLQQAPVINVPASQMAFQGPPLLFANATSNPIWISDVGSTGGTEQVTLKPGKGTVSLASTSGLTFTQGTGANDSLVTFTGTLASLNAALNGLTYKPLANYTGSDSVAITVSDLGHTVAGYPQVTTGSVGITVSNAAPTVAIAAAASPGVVSGTSAQPYRARRRRRRRVEPHL